MILVDKPISRERLKKIGEPQFGSYIKAVVDIEKGIMAGWSKQWLALN